MERTTNIHFPEIMGSLNEARKTDYTIRLCRTKCNLVPMKKGSAYCASGSYEYRIGGNSGQVDEDVAAAIVCNIREIISSIELNDKEDAELYKPAYYGIYSTSVRKTIVGVSEVEFRFENGDWYISFNYVGQLLEAEYVVNVSR